MVVKPVLPLKNVILVKPILTEKDRTVNVNLDSMITELMIYVNLV